MKKCSHCKQLKALSEFNKDRRGKSGVRPECKLCHRTASNLYREGHLEQAAVRWKLWRKENPKKYILWRAKQSAKKRNLPFSLVADDIELRETCPVLGVKLKYADAVKNDPAAASLDRIDSTKGYVKGNVTIMSFRANTMKSDITPTELEALYKYLNNKEVAQNGNTVVNNRLHYGKANVQPENCS